MKKISLLILILLFSIGFLFSQVAINIDATAPDGSAMLDVKSNSKGILVPRMTLTERNNISSPATGLMIYQIDQAPGFYYYNGTVWTSVAGSGRHYVGELIGGGVVFWVDHTGEHGLIASMIDISTGAAWSNIMDISIGSTARSDWDGMSNSNAIVNQAGHTSSSAQLCFDYVNVDYGSGIYSDWYLPSRGEFNHLWNNFFEVQKALESDNIPTTIILTRNRYWTSTEKDDSYSFWLDLTGSVPNGFGTKDDERYVRAIRAF